VNDLWDTLTDEQKEGVKALSTHTSFLLADKTGTGKSAQVLFGYRELRRLVKKDIEWVLLVLTTKTAAGVWPKENEKWVGMRCHRLESNVGNEYKSAEILVIRFNMVEKLKDQLNWVYSNRMVCLAVDEVHTLANPECQQSMMANRLRACASVIWGVTATPLLNHLEKMFYIFDFIRPGYLGTFRGFSNRYLIKEKKYIRIKGRRRTISVIVGYKNIEEIREKIKPMMLRRFRKSRADIKFHRVPTSEAIEKLYRHTATGALTAKPELFAPRLPSLQLAVDNAIDWDGEPNEDTSLTNMSNKELYMIQLCKTILRRGEGVIVFSFFHKTIARLKMVLKMGVDYNKLHVLTGSTPDAMRNKIEDELCSGDILVASASGGESRNFQAVNNIIFYNIPFDVISFIQGLGRVDRLGSEHDKIEAHILITEGTVDEYKAHLLENHIGLIQKVIGGPVELPTDMDKLSQKAIESLRKELLWKFGKSKNKGKKMTSPVEPIEVGEVRDV